MGIGASPVRRALALAIAGLSLAMVPAPASAGRLAVVDGLAPGLALSGGEALVAQNLHRGVERDSDHVTTERFEYRLLAFAPDGSHRTVLRREEQNVFTDEGAGTSVSHVFAASDSHLALSRATHLVTETGGVVEYEIVAGPIAGRLRPVLNCEGDRSGPELVLSGPTLAFPSYCETPFPVLVSSPAGTEPRRLDVGTFPHGISIGGDLLMARVQVGEDLPVRLVDSSSGQSRGDLMIAGDPEVAQFAAAADGSAVWLNGGGCAGTIQVLPPGSAAGPGITRASSVCSLLAVGNGYALIVEARAGATQARLRTVSLTGAGEGEAILADGVPLEGSSQQFGTQHVLGAGRVLLTRGPCGGPTWLESVAFDGGEELALVRSCPARVGARRARASRAGVVRVPITCPNGCAGTARLLLRGRPAGRGTFLAAPGRRGVATLHLARSQRDRVRRGRRLRGQLVLGLRDPLDGRAAPVRRTITVRR